jgi:hypothetical protein
MLVKILVERLGGARPSSREGGAGPAQQRLSGSELHALSFAAAALACCLSLQ